MCALQDNVYRSTEPRHETKYVPYCQKPSKIFKSEKLFFIPKKFTTLRSIRKQNAKTPFTYYRNIHDLNFRLKPSTKISMSFCFSRSPFVGKATIQAHN